MWTVPCLARVPGVVVIFAGAVIVPPLAGWQTPPPFLELSALLVAAILSSVLRVQQSAITDGDIMPPSFAVTFTSLLLLGSDVATLVGATGTLAAGMVVSRRTYPRLDLLLDAANVVVSTQAAGLAYRSFGGTPGELGWPWQALPIAAATLAYVASQGCLAKVIVPILVRRPVDRSWPACVLATSPTYLIGATIAVGLVELIEYRAWEVLPAAAASLYFMCRLYDDYAARLGEDHRRREVIEFIEQGMSVVDGDGRVTLWTDALERILGTSRERAIGRVLADAVPMLGGSEISRAIQETLADRQPRTLTLRLSTASDGCILRVKVVSTARGAAVLWHDVTERTQVEQELKRAGERLALAAEGANDGLWQWNLRTQEFYMSGRWRAMIGLPADAGVGRPEEWLDRVHAEDLTDLKQTLDAYLSGQTDVFQHEHRIRRDDGTYRRFLCRGVAVSGRRRGRRDRIAGSLTDTTEQAIAQERLRSVGFMDPLTGLYNRTVFVVGLGRRIEEFRDRRVSNCFAVLYLDLDRFKIVNDSLGHFVGDELLKAVSRRLEKCLRHGDALARLGGDEFAILLNGLGDDAQANAIAFRIQDALSAPFSIGGREVFTSASIGIAFGPAHYTNPDEVMRDADTAMYHAKARGKARHEVFDADMHARVRDRLSLENDLRRAIASNDFEVHYQPIVSLTSGMCVGFESLVRWTRNGEPISPVTFIPIAEELGLIEPLGTWVMQQACRTFADWQRRYPSAGLDCITVNVSSRQLVQQNFPRVVQQAVHQAGLKPADLRVEITETALMDNPGEAAGVVRELRDFGVKVYLDDFGTGYSSLSHLHKLPVDALKIDRSFVNSLLLPARPAIVESILALARTLNTSVVAEGVESDVQARELERLGCTHAQGFLFSRPLSTKLAEQVVLRSQPLGPKAGAPAADRAVGLRGVEVTKTLPQPHRERQPAPAAGRTASSAARADRAPGQRTASA
jgi:diguanylate cyclase (GGDEF)-like protein/PAS domain S-box-containing protein